MQDPGISTPRSGDQAPAGSGSQVPAGIFLAAARELGVRAGHAVVLEDAPAGVQAAKAGGMAAIGIARADDTQLLAAAGADIVVTTLDDVDTGTLAAGRLAKRKT